MSDLSVVPTRQLDRIEEGLAQLHADLDALSGLMERLLSSDQPEADRARDGFRAYRKRMRAT